jgi:phosphatidylserine/phosphatidylglycerophosphate/cardiolipin synthase-like enzyme
MIMSHQRQIIVDHAQRLATEMPLSMVEKLVAAIEKVAPAHWPAARGDILQTLSHPYYRALATGLFDAWHVAAPDLTPQAVAMALAVAAATATAKTRREAQTIELVWTGPHTKALPLRHTEQALLQVIDAALRRLTLVSYAVYKIPRICDALIRAADRGVSLGIILEAPDPHEGKHAYDALRALGKAVAQRSAVYLWPFEQRGKDTSGKAGVLHVKCAVADSHRLFLSSANLTEYAFTLNMELGVLISGGPLPGQVETHFDQLIQTEVLAWA